MTQNPTTKKPPLVILNKFNTFYEGTKAFKLTDIAEHDIITTELARLEIPYKTKILRKPFTMYYILLVDNLRTDYGNCDRCGAKLVDISWCKYCGDMGWFDESSYQGFCG